MASALQTLGQGLLRTTCATAGPSRRAIHQQRWISSTETPLQRQALGRITPKRIAVRLPPGTGGGSLPKQSILRPTLVSRLVESPFMELNEHSFAWH